MSLLKSIVININLLHLVNIAKSFLLFPNTTVLQLTYGMSRNMAINNNRLVILEFGFQETFDLPYDPSNFQVATYARKTQSSDISKETFYAYIIKSLDSVGLDGKQCLLRSICELAHTPFRIQDKNNLLERITQFILTPSRINGIGSEYQDENTTALLRFQKELLYAQEVGHKKEICQDIFSSCIISIIDFISRKYAIK